MTQSTIETTLINQMHLIDKQRDKIKTLIHALQHSLEAVEFMANAISADIEDGDRLEIVQSAIRKNI